MTCNHGSWAGLKGHSVCTAQWNVWWQWDDMTALAGHKSCFVLVNYSTVLRKVSLSLSLASARCHLLECLVSLVAENWCAGMTGVTSSSKPSNARRHDILLMCWVVSSLLEITTMYDTPRILCLHPSSLCPADPSADLDHCYVLAQKTTCQSDFESDNDEGAWLPYLYLLVLWGLYWYHVRSRKKRGEDVRLQD